MSLIDLLSIVPVFVANLPTATGILKIFKLCKILRLLKASRYLNSIANFARAIQKKKKQIIMSIIAIAVIMAICSVLMYSFENKDVIEDVINAYNRISYRLIRIILYIPSRQNVYSEQLFYVCIISNRFSNVNTQNENLFENICLFLLFGMFIIKKAIQLL